MLAVLSDVVRNIVILIIIVTILEMLLPRKDFRPFVNMVVGLVLMLMLLSPLRSLLQLPGLLDPVLEMRDSVSEEDIAAKQVMLEQMNWDLTLSRYRELVREKIISILQNADLQLLELELQLEEDVNHMEFGTPRRIYVLAAHQSEENQIAGIEKVNISIREDTSVDPQGQRNTELEGKIMEALGAGGQVVEVWVQKDGSLDRH